MLLKREVPYKRRRSLWVVQGLIISFIRDFSFYNNRLLFPIVTLIQINKGLESDYWLLLIILPILIPDLAKGTFLLDI